MNHNPSSSDDLSAALHGIADEVGSISPVVADSDFSTNVRLHAKAVRRRRRAQHTGIAAASVAIIAVAGVVIAQNLPSGTQPITPAPPAPSEASPFPACGAAVDIPDVEHGLTLVSGAHPDGDGVPAPRSAPGAEPWSTDIDAGTILPLALRNDGDAPITAGSTGYAGLVFVKDGLVVARPGGMPEPYTEPTLAPGEMTPVGVTPPEVCGSDALPDGDYEAYALLDAQTRTSSEDEPTSEVVYGGPWKIRLGNTEVPADAPSLACGDEVSELPTFTEPIRIDVDLPDDAVLGSAWDRSSLGLDFRNTDSESTMRVHADRVETFLVEGGKVIASAATKEDLRVKLKPGTSYGFNPRPPVVRCDSGEPVAAGSYQLYVIVNFTDTESDELVEAITGPVDVTVPDRSEPDSTQSTTASATLPGLDPAAQFPACGAAVPREDDSTFAMITSDPIESLPAGKETFSTEIEITNVTEDYLIGNSATWVPGVLVRDGRVVSGSGAGHDDAQDFGLAPGESFTLPLSVGLEICGTDTAQALPAGSYEVWGSTEFYLKERQLRTGESESTNDVVPSIIKLATATLG